MVTTRSGKETAGATRPALPAPRSRSPTNDPRPPARKQRSHTKKPQRSAKKGRLLALTVRPLRHQWRSASFPSRFFWTSRGHWPPPFAGFPSSFIGECWDAALEYHGGTADDEYWKSWDEGIGSTLPTKPVGKLGMTPDARENLVWELTMFLDIVSILERRSPGFANLATITAFLDRCVFHRRNRRTFGHVDLEGDWTHLMA